MSRYLNRTSFGGTVRGDWTMCWRALAALAIASVLPVLVVSPASGMIGGRDDPTSHPYVGAVDLRPAGFSIVASGVLVSPTVLVTAGHVTSFFEKAGLSRARVSFDPVVGASSTWYTGRVHTDPMYDFAHEAPQNDPNDLGVIVFDEPISGITPAALPSEGLLNHLGTRNQEGPTFQEVGYGVSARVGAKNDRSLDAWTGDGTRRVISTDFKSSHGGWLDVTPLDGNACRGDSGGPTLFGDVAVAIHKLDSNTNFCSGEGHGMRLDTPNHRAFLSAYVPVP
jgi:hypothetical protein